MADEPLWGIGGGAGGATLIAILFGVWDRFFRRKEKVEDTEKSDLDHMRTYLDARGAAAVSRLEREIERQVADLTRERARTDEMETQRNDALRDADQAWDVARKWKVRVHWLKHDLGNARGTINVQRASEGKPEIDWPDEELPPVEDIAADNVAYQERKRAWQVKQEELRRGAGGSPEPSEPK